MTDYRGPFLGLATYGEQDAHLFHGRDQASVDLTRLIRRRPLTIVCGVPGIGKSSLLRAGVFPRVRTDHVPIWIHLRFADGEPPLLDQVRTTIGEVLTNDKIDTPAPLPDEVLQRYCRANPLWAPDHSLLAPLLVFDQFEEVFTIGRKRQDEVAQLMKTIAALCDDLPARDAQPLDLTPPPPRVVLALREDYLAELEDHRRTLRGLLDDRFRLTSMTGTDAMQVVTAPAGLVDPATAEQIVRFVDSEGDVPAPADAPLAELAVDPALLSLVCEELDRARHDQSAATIAIDGQLEKGMLAGFYRRAFADLDPALRELVEDHLVTKDSRTTRSLDEALAITGVTRAGIVQLIARRIVRNDPRFKAPHIELVHDVLVPFAIEGRRERQEEVARKRIETDTAHRLDELKAEHAAADRRRRRRLKWIVALFVAVAALGIAVAWWIAREDRRAQADRARQQAEHQREKDNGDLMDRLGREALDRGDVTQAADLLLRARESLTGIAEQWMPVQDLMLTRAVSEISGHVGAVDHTSHVSGVHLGLLAERIDTYGDDGTARSWLIDRWVRPHMASPSIGDLELIVPSHASEWAVFVGAGGGGELRSLGDAAGLKFAAPTVDSFLQPRPTSATRLWKACIAPDDRSFAVWGGTGALRAWTVEETATGLAITAISFPSIVIAAQVACINDGRFAVARDGMNGSLLSVESGLGTLRQAPGLDAVLQLAASDDGNVIGVRTSGGRVRVWGPAGLETLDSALGVVDLDVSEDGTHVLTVHGKDLDNVYPTTDSRLYAVWNRDRTLAFAISRPANVSRVGLHDRALVIGSSRQIEAWQEGTWVKLGTIEIGGSAVPTLDWSRDVNGALIIAVGRDAVTRVHRLAAPEEAAGWGDHPQTAVAEQIAWVLGTRQPSGQPAAEARLRALMRRLLDRFGVLDLRWAIDGTQIVRFAERTETWSAGGTRLAAYPGHADDAITNARGILWTCQNATTTCQAWKEPGVRVAVMPDPFGDRDSLGGRAHTPLPLRLGADGNTLAIGVVVFLLPPAIELRARPDSEDVLTLASVHGGWVARQGDDTVARVGEANTLVGDAMAAPARPLVAHWEAGTILAFAEGSALSVVGLNDQGTPLPRMTAWRGRAPIAAIAASAVHSGRIGAVDAALHVAVSGLGVQPVLESTVVDARPVGSHAVFAPSGHFYAMLSAEGEIEVWSVDASTIFGRYPTGGHALKRLLLADDLVLVALVDDGLLLWSTPDTPPLLLRGDYADAIITNQNLVALRDHRAEVYRVLTGPLALAELTTIETDTIDASPLGNRLATTRNGRTEIWLLGVSPAIMQRYRQKNTIGYFRRGKGPTVFGPDSGMFAWLPELGVVHAVLADDSGRAIKGARDCRFGGHPYWLACLTESEAGVSVEIIDARDGSRTDRHDLTRPVMTWLSVDHVGGANDGAVALAVRSGRSGAQSTDLVIWNSRTRAFRTLTVPGTPSVRIGDDDDVWTLADDGLLQRWNLGDGRVVQAHGGTRVLDLAFVGDDLMLLVLTPGRGVVAYTFAVGTPRVAVVLADSADVVSARLLFSGQVIAATPTRGVLQWGLSAPRDAPVRVPVGDASTMVVPSSLTISPNQRFAAITRIDGSAMLWQLWPVVHPAAFELTAQETAIDGFAFDNGEHWLATSCVDGSVRIRGLDRFGTVDGDPLAELVRLDPGRQEHTPIAMAFAPGDPSPALLTGSRGDIHRWTLVPVPKDDGRTIVDRALAMAKVMRAAPRSAPRPNPGWLPAPDAAHGLRPR